MHGNLGRYDTIYIGTEGKWKGEKDKMSWWGWDSVREDESESNRVKVKME